jgi:hypothetical protein
MDVVVSAAAVVVLASGYLCSYGGDETCNACGAWHAF